MRDGLTAPALAVGLAWAALLPAPVAAQVTDLQRGRNFPVAVLEFGGDRSENIDLGDVDNDGDLDVVVANGGDGGPDANRIYINNGGLQGGVEGTFTDETAVRFLGVPNDTSLDIELADIDADGDLDVFVSNRGTAVLGEVSRFYVNQGGLQGGTIGTFAEDTDARWGALSGVAPGQEEGVVDGQGPFRDWSCDCDFGDLDDDGDLDLFFSSYGPVLNGSSDSRIFLNDGAGVFHELWPWADAAADTKLHTIDVDLADLDGDFDLDVFATSRDSQARVYVSNVHRRVGEGRFTDVTQQALVATGAQSNHSNNYEAEIGDLDGDGDFDVWAVNYAPGGSGLGEALLLNRGRPPGQAPEFDLDTGRILGDPFHTEFEADFIDYDGDGDLDVYLANFTGRNWLFTRGPTVADPGTDRYHRNEAGSPGEATWPELPATGDNGLNLDAEVGDMDGDGDPDIVVAKDANLTNRYYENALGVPDTHAPVVAPFTDQCDKPEGTATVVHARVMDNSPGYAIAAYAVELAWSVDGGGETTVPMVSQGGQQFRAVIPPQVGSVSYRVEAADHAGNVGLSATRAFTQAGPVWVDLGAGLAGTSGIPELAGTGTWAAGSPGALDLTGARPDSVAVLFYGVVDGSVPAFGGTLVPFPFLGPLVFVTDASGAVALPVPGFPEVAACGLEVFLQYGIEDPAAIGGVALSNALRARTP